MILIPGFLGNVQQYRALQTGHALAWVALPMFAVVWLVAIVVLYTTSRLTLALGLTVVALGLLNLHPPGYSVGWNQFQSRIFFLPPVWVARTSVW
jgi:hypothetical protein